MSKARVCAAVLLCVLLGVLAGPVSAMDTPDFESNIVTGHIDWSAVPHVAADDDTTAKYRLHDGDVHGLPDQSADGGRYGRPEQFRRSAGCPGGRGAHV